MVNTYKGKRASQMKTTWLEDAIMGLWRRDMALMPADEEMREFVKMHVKNLDSLHRRYILSAILRDKTLRADALLKGYGWLDALDLAQWFSEQFGDE